MTGLEVVGLLLLWIVAGVIARFAIRNYQKARLSTLERWSIIAGTVSLVLLGLIFTTGGPFGPLLGIPVTALAASAFVAGFLYQLWIRRQAVQLLRRLLHG